jgi:hypothetical protein
MRLVACCRCWDPDAANPKSFAAFDGAACELLAEEAPVGGRRDTNTTRANLLPMWNEFEEQRPADRVHHTGILVYLTFLAFAYSFAVVINIYAITDPRIVARLSKIPEWPQWAYGVQALCGALNLMWIAAVFFWQRLGFWGFLVTNLGMTVINSVCKLPPSMAALPLVFVALMFVFLHWGGPRSTWSKMR